MLRLRAAALLLLVGLSCSSSSGEPRVFAASSLASVFSELSPDATFNFAGSDDLTTQIREGATPDVFASAGPRYAQALLDEDLIEEPVPFATNRLVVLVPASNPANISSYEDLSAEGVTIVIGAVGVPVGDYAREVIANLGAESILDNVVSEEQSAASIVGKVALGEVDAGIAYVTDAAAASEKVASIELPSEAQVPVVYTVGLVVDAPDPARGQAFIDLVLSDEGRAALEAAGFGLP